MLPKRRKAMEATRLRVQAEYKRLLRDKNLNPDVQHRMFSLFKKRVDDLGIRSFFVHTLYRYVKAQALKEGLPLRPIPEVVFDTQLPFVAEGIITVQYYANQILDGKGGLRDANGALDKAKVDQNLLAGHFLKDCLYDYIDENIFPTDAEQSRITQKAIRRIFQLVDLGQDLQDHCGTLETYYGGAKKYVCVSEDVDNFVHKKAINDLWKIIHTQGIGEDQEWFVRNYLKRINLTNSALFVGMAEMVMDLLGYQGKERGQILDAATYIGMIVQIVNDNNDYVLPEADLSTTSKIPQDAFADLRNNNITLPLIFYLQQNKNGIENFQTLYHSFHPKQKRHTEGKNIVSRAIYFGKNLILKLLELIYRTLKPAPQKKTEIKLLTKLFPAIETSIQTTKIMAAFMESQNLLYTECEAGCLLLDMNSMTEEKHNRFYRSMYHYVSQTKSQKKKEVHTLRPHEKKPKTTAILKAKPAAQTNNQNHKGGFPDTDLAHTGLGTSSSANSSSTVVPMPTSLPKPKSNLHSTLLKNNSKHLKSKGRVLERL